MLGKRLSNLMMNVALIIANAHVVVRIMFYLFMSLYLSLDLRMIASLIFPLRF